MDSDKEMDRIFVNFENVERTEKFSVLYREH